MPTIKTPLLPFDQFRELKQKAVRARLARRVELYERGKTDKTELGELNRELFATLRAVLPAEVKSVEFEGHQITVLEGSPRRYLDTNALIETTFKCPHCRKDVMLPAKVVQGAYRLGKSPEPTVSVKKLGEKSADEEDAG